MFKHQIAHLQHVADAFTAHVAKALLSQLSMQLLLTRHNKSG